MSIRMEFAGGICHLLASTDNAAYNCLFLIPSFFLSSASSKPGQCSVCLVLETIPHFITLCSIVPIDWLTDWLLLRSFGWYVSSGKGRAKECFRSEPVAVAESQKSHSSSVWRDTNWNCFNFRAQGPAALHILSQSQISWRLLEDFLEEQLGGWGSCERAESKQLFSQQNSCRICKWSRNSSWMNREPRAMQDNCQGQDWVNPSLEHSSI